MLGILDACLAMNLDYPDPSDITQKGYEKKRSKLIGAYLPQPPTANGAAAVRCRLQPSEGTTRRTFRSAHIGVCDIREAAARERAASAAGNRPLFYFRFGVDQALPQERRAPVTPSSASRYHRRRSSGSRDERYRSGNTFIHACVLFHTIPLLHPEYSDRPGDLYRDPLSLVPAEDRLHHFLLPCAQISPSFPPSFTCSIDPLAVRCVGLKLGILEAFVARCFPSDWERGVCHTVESKGKKQSGKNPKAQLHDVHTEAVQAALAKHKERKMAVPMPSKRRSLVVQTSMDAYTPPDTSSGSEDEGSVQGDSQGTPTSSQGSINMEHWISQAIHGSTTSTTSSSSTQSGGSGAAHRLADVMAQTHIENHSAPPDVTTYTSEHSIQVERPQGSTTSRTAPKYGNAELMETGDGVPVSSRVSAKIQQLVNTLKRPKRPPLREFFVDDFEELLEVQQPDPNQPKPEGAQMLAMRGEQLGVVTNWPPSLEAALQRWGTISPKAPCLTTMDTNGKPLYILTYGKLWTRSMKVAYNILHKLGTKQEPMVRPGDRVALVFPNNDPAAFMVAFYGCLLAEVVPVPIEVPLTRKGLCRDYEHTKNLLPFGFEADVLRPMSHTVVFAEGYVGKTPGRDLVSGMDAGSQQIGFLLGSCGVTVALTSDACHKGLPKSPTGEIPQFKGWPKLLWFVTESKHLSKPPRDWFPHIKDANNDTAYIEYKTCKDGSVLGVTVTRIALLTHCQALTQACSYTEAETIVNVLDFKKDVGLWHGILTSVMNMMHVISIPYSLMKVNPLSWIQKVCQYKAKVACVKSRDMHWALVAHRDQRDVNLSSLRMLIVADGANPWSISSCDAFLNVFQSKGLRQEVICPCASSPEALTVAIRRPTDDSNQPPGRGVLSMHGLTYGVIRVDSEEKLSVLTVQDVGLVMPGAIMCSVKPDGIPQLCRTDEIGELCVCAVATGTSYYGLSGMTKNTFEVFPMTSSGAPISEYPFIRTGLLGFVGPGGLVFVVGKMDGLMVVSGRRHNADDIVATALAVEPMKFVYRGRIAVFSVTVLHDERIVIVAEQRPDSTEEDSFQWMSRVLQAIDSIHQVGVYCLALVPANTLPKTPLGGIHLSETKQLFLEGSLHPCNVLMCPHTCVTNLPKPRQKQPEIGPASVMVGNLVSGKRIAQASGRDLGQIEDNDQARKFLFLSEVLQWRAQTTPDHVLYTLLNCRGTIANSLTCVQLHKRAEKIAVMLMERGHLQDGDHVALVYPPGIDLIAAFYGCLYAGCVPITVRPPHPQNIATTLPTVKMIVEVSRSACLMTTQLICKLLRSREAAAAVDVRTWPLILDTDDLPKKRPAQIYKPSNPDMLAYLDFSVSTTGMLAGVKMSHAATSAFCRSIKLQCELYPSREVAICLDPYCGLGFVLWCLCSVYSGHQSILIPPSELETNPALWLLAVSQYKVRDTFCSYSVMELCTKGLGSQTESLKARGLDLSRVRTCVVVAEERPRIALTQSFSKLFKDLGLHPRAVSTSFGCRVNLAICLQFYPRIEKVVKFTMSGLHVELGIEGAKRKGAFDVCSVLHMLGAGGYCLELISSAGSASHIRTFRSAEIPIEELRGTSGPDPTTVYVDMRALRHDRVRLVERGSPHSLPLMESGKILPGVRIIIANPETKGPLGDSHLGEIWVHSAHNASGYFTIYGDESLQSDHFNSRLSFGDTQTIWARTGYLGFLRRTELTDANGERHDALYVVGALDEAMELRGMRYHPIDIETSVIRAHKSVTECAVFTWTNLLVVVVELDGSEQEALDLVPLVTNVVLEEHYLIVGVVVVVDIGVIPINSRGEKQRMHLRDGFLADQLDPIYVAYNM
ncbi:Disco-interacting protein 2 like protein C [Fukomys damarensis]|uniref:Disco-interacting protein 2 like protein C n=1 Tax=Fukomys damarensis TaxID=885580 RepID=A0A091CL66_FUKDA|nr:Disco-interacting protein 2 like protein C [Fukomys damarensis]